MGKEAKCMMCQAGPNKKNGRGDYLHYITQGSGKCVVLLHGSPGLLKEFTLSPLFDKIASRFHVIIMDRPGYGCSRPSFHSPALDHTVTLIRNTLQSIGAQKPMLVGHSYGGSVALQYAHRYSHEISGLILIAPAAYPYNASVIGKLTARISVMPVVGSVFLSLLGIIGRLVAPGICKTIFYPHSVPSYYKRRILPLMMQPSQVKSFLKEWKGFNKELRKMVETYDKINLPTTIIVGAQDRLINPEFHGFRLHKAIRNSKLLVLKDAGHMIHHTHSDVILEAILNKSSDPVRRPIR